MTLAWLMLLALSAHQDYQFYTDKYSIEMRVTFPSRYEGKRLVVYRGADPVKAGCIENFVGAAAVVAFTVKRVADGNPASASIREVVTLAEQSPGLPERPPHDMSINLINGTGSDLQAFGYDESLLPAIERASGRQAAKATWRRLRQELYMDRDRQPFAVIEWEHSITGIRILRAYSPSTLGTSAAPPR